MIDDLDALIYSMTFKTGEVPDEIHMTRRSFKKLLGEVDYGDFEVGANDYKNGIVGKFKGIDVKIREPDYMEDDRVFMTYKQPAYWYLTNTTETDGFARYYYGDWEKLCLDYIETGTTQWINTGFTPFVNPQKKEEIEISENELMEILGVSGE